MCQGVFFVFDFFSFLRPHALENVRSATVKRHNELASVLLDKQESLRHESLQ